MSDLIRSFRIANAPFTKGRQLPDGRTSPFMLPVHKKPERTPEVEIEGVPPLAKPKEDRRDT